MGEREKQHMWKIRRRYNIKLTQVAKNHFAFATALLWH
jgi:hypothetical protein